MIGKLKAQQLPRAFSYPKHRIKVLLLEDIHPKAVAILSEEGYTVETLQTAISEEELMEKVRGVSILGIRSRTNITERVLKNAKKLLTVGAFCIGTDQIDLLSATNCGVAVFNAPYSNTRSVVELVLAEIICLLRKIGDRNIKMQRGEWFKSVDGSHEVRGKKIGIIGYGNIGSQLSVLAEFLGMEVYFYDIAEKLALGNAKKCRSLEELLGSVEIVTVHVDGREENRKLIGEREFEMMRNGAYFLNTSRGFIVDLDALAKYIKTGRIAGAAVDVFPNEPKSNKEKFESVLRGLSNTILTSHIGGSTQEAQGNIAVFVAEKIIEFINTGNTMLSVNFPNLALPERRDVHRFIHIHKNIPAVLAQINSVLAKNGINIEGQYLKTNEEMGYAITDVNKDYPEGVVAQLKKIKGTIKFRVLY